MKNYVIISVKNIFKDLTYTTLTISLSANILFLYYLLFMKSTTFEVFFNSNNAVYNWLAIVLTIVNSALFGIAITLMFMVRNSRQRNNASGTSNGIFGAVLGAVSTGCPVCGAWLLPLLGIAGSLAAFPLQGLEIKILSIILLVISIVESAKSLAGLCPVYKEKLFTSTKDDFIFVINKNTLLQNKSIIIVILSVLAVYMLPNLPSNFKTSFSAKKTFNTQINLNQSNVNSNIDTSALFAQVNPKQGYTVDASFGNIGPKLLEAGAIDIEKFKSIYERSGQPLTDEQLAILTKGSDKKIKIDSSNSYFMINLLWALGLANKNKILDEGQMTKYGKDRIGSFASTGGWTVGSKKVMDIYSKSNLITLTPAQQAIVDEAAQGTYRPCCGNSTAFPDCNHGMAMLGLYELMASQGASVEDLYKAGKYFNAFWFPQQTLDIALYFEATQGKTFDEVDPAVVVSKDFSSGPGWSKTKRWLSDNKLIEKVPQRGGGGCGV